MRNLWSLSVALAVLVCTFSAFASSASAPIVLTVEPRTAAPGETITLVLRNQTASPIAYNLCPGVLERKIGDADWEAVPSTRACTAELRTLQSGRQVRYALELPVSLMPGEYRYATRVELVETGGHTVRSARFSVSQ